MSLRRCAPIIVNFGANINGKFVVAENAGNGVLIANRDAAGLWEKFTITKIGECQ